MGYAKVSSYKDELIELTENCVEEIEKHLRETFKNDNLKLAFRISDGTSHITPIEFIQQHVLELGEIKVYVIPDKNYNTLETIFKHEDFNEDDIMFLGGFSLNELHGCCGISVFYKSYVMPEYRNKGIGQRFVRLAECISNDKDFSLMICTDRLDNHPQIRIMDKLGFSSNVTFKNRKTENLVELRSINLQNLKYQDLKCQNSIFQRLNPLKRLVKKIFSTTIIK